VSFPPLAVVFVATGLAAWAFVLVSLLSVKNARRYDLAVLVLGAIAIAAGVAWFWRI
jgi:hypothetical protein